MIQLTPEVLRISFESGEPLRVRFGDYVLYSGTRELTRRGRAVPLSPKVFELLELLLERRPEAVAKDAIHDRLWPKSFVSESSLARLAAEARAALADDARKPRYLRTVFGFGYAFCGEAVEERPRVESGLACHLTIGPRKIPLSLGENVLGRADEAVVSIPSTKASRRHARIVVEERSAALEDLASKNGTFLRGQLIEAPSPLSDGDEITIGEVVITFRITRGGGSTETASRRGTATGLRGGR
jgi:DNA-binding winged helix-turn-helix (wHTH) protein